MPDPNPSVSVVLWGRLGKPDMSGIMQICMGEYIIPATVSRFGVKLAITNTQIFGRLVDVEERINSLAEMLFELLSNFGLEGPFESWFEIDDEGVIVEFYGVQKVD